MIIKLFLSLRAEINDHGQYTETVLIENNSNNKTNTMEGGERKTKIKNAKPVEVI
jgi:hypothetical protein